MSNKANSGLIFGSVEFAEYVLPSPEKIREAILDVMRR
jgi:hypothetical protein